MASAIGKLLKSEFAWKMVKNYVRNRSRPDEIDTETEICTSLKSEFYFLFVNHQVESQS